MTRASLHGFYVVTPLMMSPRNSLCNGQSHELQTKLWLSKCDLLTRCELHEIYEMSRKFNFPRCFHASNVRGLAVRTPTFRRFTRIDSQRKITYFWSTWPDSRESRLLSDSHWISRDSRPVLAAIPFFGRSIRKKEVFSKRESIRREYLRFACGSRIDSRESAH